MNKYEFLYNELKTKIYDTTPKGEIIDDLQPVLKQKNPGSVKLPKREI
jgi:hypothetical protein